eukprot:1139152-Pelagomonas_calceolata.AAC.2
MAQSYILSGSTAVDRSEHKGGYAPGGLRPKNYVDSESVDAMPKIWGVPAVQIPRLSSDAGRKTASRQS